jgi:hypothetical protein
MLHPGRRGGSVIRNTVTMIARLAKLWSKKLSAGPRKTMMTPPIAGPKVRITLKAIWVKATALGNTSRGTLHPSDQARGGPARSSLRVAPSCGGATAE